MGYERAGKAYWLGAVPLWKSDKGLDQMTDSLCWKISDVVCNTLLSSCCVFSKMPRNLSVFQICYDLSVIMIGTIQYAFLYVCD